MNIGLNILTAAGVSTATDDELPGLLGGGHDPQRRGVTLQQMELGLSGETNILSVFDQEELLLGGAAYAVWGEDGAELEEAFVGARRPFAYEFEAGVMFTEFGINNPLHPHAWNWIDQPVVLTRMFGADGMRGPGLRAAYTVRWPWQMTLHGGMHDAFSETMSSFGGGVAEGHHHGGEEEEPAGVGGRPLVERERRSLSDVVWLLRWSNSGSIGRAVGVEAGISTLWGPNSTGIGGKTAVSGVDLSLYFWDVPSDGDQRPFVEWRTEAIHRRYHADDYFSSGDDMVDPADDIALNAATLTDWGLVSQALWHIGEHWSAGLRAEHARADGASFHAEERAFESPSGSALRDTRTRVSPLLAWQPMNAVRMRLQYNADHAAHLDDGWQHSTWLCFEWRFGAHG